MSGDTRSGNGKRGKSGARLRRTMERADANGWRTRRDRNLSSFERWIKTFENVKTHDKYGNTFYAYDRPALIHKGRKP